TTGTTLLVAAADGLLANDTDANGDTLNVFAFDATGSAGGTLAVGSDGGFTYDAAAGFTGSETFSYAIADGRGGTDDATLTIGVDEQPSQDIVRIEAEAMTLSGNFKVETSGVGSGGQMVRAGQRGQTYEVSTVFDGEPGAYLLSVRYHAEGDGDSSYVVFVDGQPVDAWTADEPLGGANVTAENARDRIIEIELQPGQTVTVSGTGEHYAWARLDYIEFERVGDATGNPGGSTNVAPVANDDVYDATAGTTLVVAAADGLLANDTDANGDTLDVSMFDATGTAGGTLSVGSDGGFTYDAAAGFTGSETFSYAIADGRGGTDDATLTIGVDEQPSEPPLRIMAFGDSLTLGVTESKTGMITGGYRPPLEDLLTANGIAFDFVGPLNQTIPGLEDGDHAGYSGRTIDFIDGFDDQLIANHDPDVVLLLIGTNDTKLDDLATMLSDARALLLSMDAASPDALLLVASIPPIDPAGSPTSRVELGEAYNAGLELLVAELVADGLNAAFVDMRALTLDDISDLDVDRGLHPNEQGYARIAEFWADAIETGLQW
ncbi:Ig-like domain-containing protein, partial [Rhizobiaceae bacterium]|nr:Ig-like domain-containing protein [Rhizobiaceae bacterium]